MKNNTNIRVYKSRAIKTSSPTYYAIKYKDDRGTLIQPTLKSVAETIKSQHDELKSFTQLSVDFTPFHDGEFPSGLSPQRCSPLNSKEIEEFWDHLKELYTDM